MNPSLPATLDDVLRSLRRWPDVEAANLQAWDATDRLLLETAAADAKPAQTIVVINDRYGALTLGAQAVLAPKALSVHQDLITGERALARNAERLGMAASSFRHLPLGPELLAGASTILLQLPKTLAELDEIAAAVAHHAPAHAVLLAGGRVKHMSLGMNKVLEQYFGTVQPQLARQKSRVIVASAPRRDAVGTKFPVLEHLAELDLQVAAHGAVFAGATLDIGTRFLLDFLPAMRAGRHAVDLGCGTGILAAMYARQFPGSAVTASDQSAAAVASAQATARANGLTDQITVLQDDALSTFPPKSADVVLLNPPFHVGAGVHTGAGLKLIRAAARILEPGGELWTVYNRHLPYLPTLEREVGATSSHGQNAKFTVTRSIRRAAATG